MDHNLFTQRITQVLLTTVNCNDCGRKCQEAPRRNFVKKNNLWREKCQACGFTRDHTGEFSDLPHKKMGRPRLIPTSDSLTMPLLKSNQQSQPTELVSIDCFGDAVESAEPEQDLEPAPSVRQDPESCGPSDHLRLDIVIHKLKHEHQD